jgi:hypothetical protein
MVGQEIGNLVRAKATYRNHDSGKASSTLDMAIKSQGLIQSSIRTARVCGPNDNNNNSMISSVWSKWSCWRQKMECCSRYGNITLS